MATNPYRGVTKARGHRHTGWQAQIRVPGGSPITWGARFEDSADAARVADVMAIYLQGPNARLNFDGRPPVGITRAAIRQFLTDRGAIRHDCQEPQRFLEVPLI